MGLAADIRIWTGEHFPGVCMSRPIDNTGLEKTYLVIKREKIWFCARFILEELEYSDGYEFIEIPPLNGDDLFTSEVETCIDKARHEWTANVRHFFATRLNDEITKRDESVLKAAKELAEQQRYMGFDFDSIIDMLDGEYELTDTELDEIYAHLESL